MKYLFTLVISVLLSTSVTAQSGAAAPTDQALEDQIALARQSAHTDRKLLIMGNVNFTSDESAQFWPAWNDYRTAVASNGDRKLALIKDFAANYESMDDLKARKLLTDHFSIAMQDVVIKQKFAQQIDTFLPTKKVMRVIQIENKLDAAINMTLASEIPLIQ